MSHGFDFVIAIKTHTLVIRYWTLIFLEILATILLVINFSNFLAEFRRNDYRRAFLSFCKIFGYSLILILLINYPSFDHIASYVLGLTGAIIVLSIDLSDLSKGMKSRNSGKDKL